MAGNPPFIVLDLVALAEVCGGIEKDTAALQKKIQAATSAMEDIANANKPKDTSLVQMMLQYMPRGGKAGPTPAPALPPTSTLTR
jgi:hypothetical protein